jgi:hypothetical protein
MEKKDAVVADRLTVSKDLKQQFEEFTFEWPERIPCRLYSARHRNML